MDLHVVDRPVTGAAGTAERSLVACLRWVVAGYPSYERAEFDRIRALATALVGEAAAEGVLTDLITLLAQARAASGAVPDVAQPGALHVSAGETCFLSLVASVQQGSRPEALHAAISFCGAFDVGYVVAAAERLGACLTKAGWQLCAEEPGARTMLQLATLNQAIEPAVSRALAALDPSVAAQMASVSSVAGRQ